MSKYEIGVRLHDYGCASPDEMFRRMTADGFTACQLAYTKSIEGINSYADITDQTVADTLAAMKKYNVKIGVLGCYNEYAIDQEEVRLANVETIKNLMPVCKALGASCIGFETTNMAMQKPETTREMAQQLLIDSLKRIMPEAEKVGIIVAIEPVSWHSMNTAEATKMVMEAVNSPNLKVIFDAGNVLTAADVDNQKEFWPHVMSIIGDQIVAVHYKTQKYDENGKPVACHQADNQLDWDIIFSELDKLPQSLPILREEQKLPYVEEDMAELRRLTRI